MRLNSKLASQLVSLSLASIALALPIGGCSPDRGPARGLDVVGGDSFKSPKAFEPRQLRYMTPHEIIQSLQRNFPGPIDGMPEDCQRLTPANRSLLGDSSPQSGSPIFTEPTGAFVRWYLGCLDSYISQVRSKAQAGDVAERAIYFGSAITERASKDPGFLNRPWNQLSERERVDIVLEHIERMIGPSEIIQDFGYFASSEDMAKRIAQSLPDPALPLTTVMKDVLIAIAIRDEFLSY